MSRSRLTTILLSLCALLLLAPSAAPAASGHAGHIDLQDGLTLLQQYGYAPEFRQNVVTFDANNVPTIRSRGANEDDTSFVQRLEGGSWDGGHAWRFATSADFLAGVAAPAAAAASTAVTRS